MHDPAYGLPGITLLRTWVHRNSREDRKWALPLLQYNGARACSGTSAQYPGFGPGNLSRQRSGRREPEIPPPTVGSALVRSLIAKEASCSTARSTFLGSPRIP